jgi:hypothetical protein
MDNSSVIFPTFPNIRGKIFSAWENNHPKRTGMVHVSDLSYCFRKSVFSRTDLNHSPPSQLTIRNLLVGEAVHRHIQNLLGDEFEREKEIIWTGPSGTQVVAHVDLYHKETGTVIELKTTGSPAIMKSPPVAHIRQLKTYMSLLDSNRGILLYLLTSDKNNEYFQEWQVTWANPNERQDILDKLDKAATELSKGFESGDPSQVRHIYYDKQYISRWTGVNWMCRNYCPYSEQCREMRIAAGEEQP